MNPPQPHVNRHGVQGLQVSTFTEAQIAEANRLHDARYGWTDQYGRIYTNASRRPESVYVPASKCWEDRK